MDEVALGIELVFNARADTGNKKGKRYRMSERKLGSGNEVIVKGFFVMMTRIEIRHHA
ncbi:hypothetical protein D3C86_2259430 [compost metagenome]